MATGIKVVAIIFWLLVGPPILCGMIYAVGAQWWSPFCGVRAKILAFSLIQQPRYRELAMERNFHERFAEHRVSGEWFRDHPDIRDYIVSRQRECRYRAGLRT